MKEQVQANYDRLARWYDLFAGSEKKFTAAGVRLLRVQPGERVIEIGCGTGHALSWLKQAAGPGLSVGVDLSAGMLRVARNRVAGAGIPLIQADALKLPFRGKSFDAIFLSFTLELFPAPESLLLECRRALKPGGRIGVVALQKSEALACRLYEWGHDRWPGTLDCRPIRVGETLEAAGFRVEKLEVEAMWGLPVGVAAARLP